MNTEIAEVTTVHRRLFLGIARKYAAPDIDPEDCLQDASVLALRFAKHFRGGSLSCWFGSIVRNCALMASRRRRLMSSIDETIGDNVTFADILRDRAASAEDRILVLQTLTAMEGLPRIYREVLEQMHLNGTSLIETATHLRVPVGTVKARRARGKRMLRKALGVRFRKAA